MIDSNFESSKYESIRVTIVRVSNCIRIGKTIMLNAALCWN